MTTLDPSHLPWLADTKSKLTGQATLSQIPVFDQQVEEDELDGRRGWQRRARRPQNNRIPAPVMPIPDQRFEAGFLLSLGPFIRARLDKDPEEPAQATAESAMAQPAARDLFDGPIVIAWPSVFWIILRDQVVSPLVQGAAWSIGALLLRTAFTKIRNR